jgi:rhamnosyltransferase subunit B
MAHLHAILVSTGTDGDVFPFIGLGAELRRRGHRVTLVVNEHYGPTARRLGLEFRALVSDEETRAFLSDPDLWHPIKAPRAVARWGFGNIGRQYHLLAELARESDSVLVANPGVLGARLVQEKLRRPMATLLLQPAMLISYTAPPVMPFGLTLPAWAPRPVGDLYWRLIDVVADRLIGPSLNHVRAGVGLRRVRRTFRWWMSPERIIGLFPDWYGPPQADWPPQLRLAGFGLFDGGGDNELSPDLPAFCKAAEPPVAFTLGTGMMHAAEFFRAALAACAALGRRGLFLTKYRHHLPAALPPSVLHCEFAPFGPLLPHCAALVHHGGVGTVARALSAGVPQLVLPLAWDQPDNAARVERLGVGARLGRRHRTGPQLAAALGRLLTPAVRERCRAVAARFGAQNGLANAADLVEELADSPVG